MIRALLTAALAFPMISGAAGASGIVRPDSTPSPFLVKPYLQLGDAASTGDPTTMSLLWHTDTMPATWEVDARVVGAPSWMPMRSFWPRRMAPMGFPPHEVYEGTLGSFAPGSTFEYRIKRNGVVVFSATGHARKGADQPYRVVVFGDCGVNEPGQKAIAYRASLEHPDLVAIPGDIVYGAGRMSEYRTNFFPVYNADSADPAVGAPLTRSIPFVAALGNHDAGYAEKNEKVHDEWAFFAYWSLPLDGPYQKRGSNTPYIWGDSSITDTVGMPLRPKWPQMANYSFDYGNAHWTVLDANDYVDWTDARLRNWVVQDLAKAKGATWKFVMFHQPGFNSSRAHFTEQQMRLLADVFEAGGVDMVISGHVHNYQRSYPFTFVMRLDGDPKVAEDGVLHKPETYDYRKFPYTIDGDFTIDHTFDGIHHTVPHGIIYMITGGGGAGLYTPEQTGERASWQPFTETLIADRHSFSVMDITGRTLTWRQLDETGKEIDHFVVTKPALLAAKPQGLAAAQP
jgi:acid phosphatase type 7